MMKLTITLGASLFLCGHALAQDVYPGCEAPTPVANHRTFFVDPVKGTDKGDGTAQHPWKSLNTVLAPANKLIATKSHKTVTGSPLLDVNPTAPIKGGDTIMLMSGNYGDVTLANLFNDKFITVMPAPGAKPVIAHLKITGGSRWSFQGLTFQAENPLGVNPGAISLVYVADGWGDTTKNITFDQDTFQTAEDSRSWTDTDWYSKPNFAALDIRSACIAVTNSTLKNLMNGIVTYGAQTLIKNNTIDRFSVDAIDAIVGQLSIVKNTITNGMYNATSASHPDAIAVWSPFVGNKITKVASEILIDSNKIYTPKGIGENVLQGISCGACDNVTIQNNVVVVNHWNAIAVIASTNARVLNNTVMPSDPDAHPTWIVVKPNVFGASRNIVVRNNVASYINLLDGSVTLDHNAASRAYSTLQGAKTVWQMQSDTKLQNLVSPTLESGFTNWDPTKDRFDVHLKAKSVLAGIGSPLSAPLADADGRTRATPLDVGAFSR